MQLTRQALALFLFHFDEAAGQLTPPHRCFLQCRRTMIEALRDFGQILQLEVREARVQVARLEAGERHLDLSHGLEANSHHHVDAGRHRQNGERQEHQIQEDPLFDLRGFCGRIREHPHAGDDDSPEVDRVTQRLAGRRGQQRPHEPTSLLGDHRADGDHVVVRVEKLDADVP